MGKLKIREHMTTKEKRMALEAALLLGFQAEASVFPVAGPKGEISVPENEEELKALYHISSSELPEGYEPVKGIRSRCLIWISEREGAGDGLL